MSWGVSPGLRSDRNEKTGWFAVKTAGAVSTEGNAGPGDVRGRDSGPAWADGVLPSGRAWWCGSHPSQGERLSGEGPPLTEAALR